MEIAILLLLAVVGGLYLSKNKKKSSKSTSPSKKTNTSTSKKTSLRVYTKMDVPMIRSRIEKLNATDGLSEYAKKKLDKLVLALCSGKEPMHWWEPLRKFSQLPTASKEAKFMFVNAQSTEGQRVTEFVLNLSEMIRFCGLRFSGVETKEGDKIQGSQLNNETYSINSIYGEEHFSMELIIKDDAIEISTFIASINELLAQKRATHRIVQFEPDHSVYCLLCTGYTEYKLSEKFI